MKKLIFIFSIALFSFLAVNAQKKAVIIDNFFNKEFKKNADSILMPFHYLWQDTSINGYSIWGSIFENKGFTLKTLGEAPTKEGLKGSSIYIISDPDNNKESTSPNYMTEAYANVISDWVKKGNVLVMLTNDSVNNDLVHFNTLANKFGIHFTDKIRNSVLKDITVGRIRVPDQNEIFKKAKVLYLKGISTILTTGTAQPLIEDNGDIIMAKATYGKGTVFALGDPWIYNEYIVNFRLNDQYQNGLAASEFTDWLIKQIVKKKPKK